MVGKSRDTEVMIDGLAIALEMATSGEQCAGGIGRSARLA